MKKVYNIVIKGVCNTNCCFCNFIEKKIPIEPEEHLIDIKNQVNEAVKLGYSELYIGFFGYEPTTFPLFEEALMYMKEKNLVISLNSNGVLFSNIDFSRRISKYIDIVYITLYSSDNKEHFLYTQKKQSYLVKHLAISNLLNFGVQVKINILVLKNTLNSVIKIINQTKKYWKNKNFNKKINISITSPEMDEIRMKYLMLNYVFYVEKINEILDYLYGKIDSGICFTVGSDIPRCIISLLKRRKFLKINYSSSSLSSNYKYSDKCHGCKYKNNKSCKGINSNYLEFFGDFEIGENNIKKYKYSLMNDSEIYYGINEAKNLYN